MALLSGSTAVAEDAVQEAMAKAWELEDRGRRVESLPGFVTTVARNLLRDRFRRSLAERRARGRLSSPGGSARSRCSTTTSTWTSHGSRRSFGSPREP